MAEDFAIMHPNPETLTTHPLPESPNDQGYPLLPPFYRRFVKGIPFIAGKGDAYVKVIDDFIANSWVGLVAQFSRASRFDTLVNIL